jgi:hypothetical protein
MTADLSLVWIGAALGIVGVAALRLAWAQANRSRALNGIGWLLLAVGAIAGGAGAGAWGVAVASLFPMGLAMLLLAVAAMRSPAGKTKASNRRVNMLPEAGEPKRIGRRIGTFLIVVVAGLTSSIALAVALRAAGSAIGWSEADAIAFAFFSVPIIWGILAFVLLMQQSRKAQTWTLLGTAAPVLPFLLTGAW